MGQDQVSGGVSVLCWTQFMNGKILVYLKNRALEESTVLLS